MKAVEGECPLCGSDLKGNENEKYYCRECNFLFRKEELKMRPDAEDSEEL